MLALYGAPLAFQVALPVILLSWQALGPNRSKRRWLIKSALVGLYIVAVHLVGLWTLLPSYTALLFLLTLAATALWQLPRIRTLPWTGARASLGSIAWRSVVGMSAVFILLAAVAGRRPPSYAIVDLEFPLRNGVYYVAGGGSNQLLNPHLMTLSKERFRAYRGQSYGIDLLELGPYGRRASGILPADPARYVIYGEPVHAPCSGVVVRAEDGARDMPPPRPDRTRMTGNYVLLDCAGVHVLLAHLKQGSVRVRSGERLPVGTVVGVVGNSGNSNEPHLHIHAQRPASAGQPPLSGDPLPVRFSGRYVVRNDRIDAGTMQD